MVGIQGDPSSFTFPLRAPGRSEKGVNHLGSQQDHGFSPRNGEVDGRTPLPRLMPGEWCPPSHSWLLIQKGVTGEAQQISLFLLPYSGSMATQGTMCALLASGGWRR